MSHGIGWQEATAYYATMQEALHTLFADADFPAAYTETELRYERDALGKPFVVWDGKIADWAQEQGRDNQHLHISNTHDGGAHIVIATYDSRLAGVGIDAVYLPRLRSPEKDQVYLRRFAARFMSPTEAAFFAAASSEDDVNALRLRVAAHFSLMEAASKACGTGLKIGGGMGRATSLPKQSLGVRALEPTVELLLEGEALARLETLGVTRTEAHWSYDESFLVSVVLLWKK